MALKSKHPRAPKHLRKDGAQLYRDIAAEYEITDSAGTALLTTACECLDRMRAAQRAIEEHGEMTLDRYGCPKINPAIGLEKDSRAHFILALKALSLDIEPIRNRVGRPALSGYTGGSSRAD
jgi:P27 family predicted phage terminase small subunit